MPTDGVFNRSFQSVFSGTVRYEIPFFQRGYAWTRDQWKQLLADLEEQVVAEVGDDGTFDDHEHFFGPVVVLEKTNAPHPSLKQFLVIDGQQRLTTVYVMLIVLHGLFKAKSHLSFAAEDYAEKLAPLLSNNLNVSGDSYLDLKVFSSKGDRLPTYLALTGQNPISPFLAADQQLYVADQNGIKALDDFLRRTLRTYDVPRLWQLAQAITKSLKIVWIPLSEGKDDPQAIFESLNDKGMPLSASELLCNFLFRPLTNVSGIDHERLHNEKWLQAQHQVGQQFETYLRFLFSIGESKMIGKDRRLYVHFKNKNKNLTQASALAVLDRIQEGTKYFLYVVAPQSHDPGDDQVRQLLRRISATNMSTAYPFIMAVLWAWKSGNLTLDDTRKLLRETYVLLMRRKLTGLATTRYDSFFPNLLARIINEPNKVQALQTAALTDDLYISDQVLSNALEEKELYNHRELAFARHVLEELDRSLQLHGELPDYSTLDTIEHVLPQTLTDEWRTALGNAANDVNLPRLRNTIGNLGLNSRSANSSFGNADFATKKDLYQEHLSSLNRAISAHPGPWNEDAIRANSRKLATQAQTVWAWTLV